MKSRAGDPLLFSTVLLLLGAVLVLFVDGDLAGFAAKDIGYVVSIQGAAGILLITGLRRWKSKSTRSA